MNKQLISIVILAIMTVLAVAAILFLNRPANNVLTQSTSQTQDVDLNKVALPQLSTDVADNESLVVVTTTAGDIEIKLFNDEAPLAVENFLQHAQNGYYDGTVFHRVIKDFMIQGGDPNGDGSGGQSIWQGKNRKIDAGQGFKNEVSPSLYNIRGALSMANAGPDTNGSQFFINQNQDDVRDQLNPDNYPDKIVAAYQNGGNPSLDGSYTVFGQVISGMAVVDKIANAKVKTSGNGEASTPLNPVKVTAITLKQTAQ